MSLRRADRTSLGSRNGSSQRFSSPPPLGSGANTLAEKRLVYQTQKLKEARAAFMEKLEVYRQQYEEMHLRALASELEVTSLQLHVEKLTENLTQSEGNVKFLADQLSAQKKVQSERDKKFQRFQSRLSEIRSALTTEVDKLRINEKDLRIALDSISRCVLEFRNGAISKPEFLAAIDLIVSTVTRRDRSPPAYGANGETVFGNAERQRLASLPRDLRKTRLQELMNLLNERELGATTDEDILDTTPSPPPVPPRQSPSLPRRKTIGSRRDARPRESVRATYVSSDSDSSDFEHFVPPVYPRKRYRSEPQCVFPQPFHPCTRQSSLPQYTATPSSALQSSSPVLTRKPSWLESKQQGKTQRSQSLDAAGHLAVAARIDMMDDSDDNTGDTSGYAKPFEHLLAWRRVIRTSDMSNILTGSLPHLDKALDDSDVNGGYLDPSEIAVALSQSGGKLGRKVSRRLMRRVDTMLSSSNNHYLSLVNTLPREPSTPADPPTTPYVPMETAVSSAKSWRGKSFDFSGRHGHSGGASEINSVEWLHQMDNSGYSVIPHGNRVEDPPNRTDGIYEELKYHQSHWSPGSPQGPQGEHPSTASYADPAMRLEDGYCRLEDSFHGFSINLGPQTATCHCDNKPPVPPPRKPAPPPRKRKPSKENVLEEHLDPTPTSLSNHALGLGPLPLYTTLRGHHRRVKLVAVSPYASSDEHHGLSDSERPEHLYSLGKFVSVDSRIPWKKVAPVASSVAVPSRRATHSVGPTRQQLLMAEVSPPIESSDAEEKEAEGGGRGDEGVGAVEGHTQLKPVRSHTFTPSSSNMVEKQEEVTTLEWFGYLRKMGPKQKHWTRRWFVLKGSELKYYRSKESFFGLNRPRGTIDLASWCRLTRDEMTAAFQLATPKRTYHLLADNHQDCQEWIRVLQAVMRTPLESAQVTPKAQTISGWAKVTQKDGSSKKVWCELDVDKSSLNFSTKPGDEPVRRIGMRRTTIKKVRDSLLMDSQHSTGNLHGSFLAIAEGEEEGGEGEEESSVYLAPENKEDEELWYYHLSAASAGDLGPVLTHTERLLAKIMQEGGGASHVLWKHPVLTCTGGPLRRALTSLASAELNQVAKNLFQSVQLFLSTPIDPLGLDYHLLSVQNLLHHGLRQPQLRNELYCQVLRQISGHTTPTSSPVLQGWYLLFLMIPNFLPTRIFLWYLRTFIERHLTSPHAILAEYARQCQLCLQCTERSGGREYRPSRFELLTLMSRCVHMPTAMQARLKIAVYLMDGCAQDVDFTPSTTVAEFTAQLNQRMDLPDPSVTGFALMSDWPGTDDPASFYLFPDNKLCDVIAMWTDALEELSSLRGRQHRGIMLTYRRRIYRLDRRGKESDCEAILLAYQLSKEVLSGRHPITNMDAGVRLAALMAQVEYGNWGGVADGEREGVVRESLQRYCPSRFTHHALEHDQSLLQRKLAEQWRDLEGMSPEQCARDYLTTLQQWRYYGAALFSAEEHFSSHRRRSLWLAVHEEGVSLLDNVTMDTIVSYVYSEVSTFGGHGDDFVLVVSPQHRSPGQAAGNQLQSEKLLLAMPTLKIREATFLMASYLEAYGGPQPSQTPPRDL